MSKAIPTRHRPNLKSLEIHITYRCNLRCYHCSNLITQAPSNETMTLAHFDELLADSVRLNWQWGRLILHGGEPTMHPQFEEICQRLADYKAKHNPNVELFVCTNGYGEKVKSQMVIASSLGVVPSDSKKSGVPDVHYHIAFSVSAIDEGKDYMLGCFQSSLCGIAYTNQGFYECSPAGAAWRVFGHKPMAKRLEDVTEEVLAAGYAEHCKHCGYARVDNPANVESMADLKQCQQSANAGMPMSKTWQEACDAYNAKK